MRARIKYVKVATVTKAGFVIRKRVKSKISREAREIYAELDPVEKMKLYFSK